MTETAPLYHIPADDTPACPCCHSEDLAVFLSCTEHGDGYAIECETCHCSAPVEAWRNRAASPVACLVIAGDRMAGILARVVAPDSPWALLIPNSVRRVWTEQLNLWRRSLREALGVGS